jgi:hypothetical protein
LQKGQSKLKSGIIKKPHHNNNSDVFEFRNKFQNQNLTSLGISIINMKDFKMKEEMQIWE